jgi:hypothetical protein
MILSHKYLRFYYVSYSILIIIVNCKLYKQNMTDALRRFFFFFGGGTGVWIQGFLLAKQPLYHLSHFSSLP